VDAVCRLSNGEACIVGLLQNAEQPFSLRRLLTFADNLQRARAHDTPAAATSIVSAAAAAASAAVTTPVSAAGMQLHAAIAAAAAGPAPLPPRRSLEQRAGVACMPVHVVAICDFDAAPVGGQGEPSPPLPSDGVPSASFVQVFRPRGDPAAMMRMGAGRQPVVDADMEREVGGLLTVTVINLRMCPDDPDATGSDAERWGSILKDTTIAARKDWGSWDGKYRRFMSLVTSPRLTRESEREQAAKATIRDNYVWELKLEAECSEARRAAAEAALDDVLGRLAKGERFSPAEITKLRSEAGTARNK
jgi:hypothetical protein